MQYPNIIELIDEYLERLIEARRLLAELDLPSTQRKIARGAPSRVAELKSKVTGKLAAHPVNRISRPELVLRKKLKPAVEKLNAENLLGGPAKISNSVLATVSMVAPDTVKPRETEIQRVEKRTVVRARKNQPPQKRVAPLKSPVKKGVLALGGTIPTGPIVVSAQQIRNERSLRLQESTTGRGLISPSKDVPLTAELLAQRWIQGSQFSAN